MESIGLCLSDHLCRSALKLGLVGVLFLLLGAVIIAGSTWWLLRKQSRLRGRLGWDAVPRPAAPAAAGAHQLGPTAPARVGEIRHAA